LEEQKKIKFPELETASNFIVPSNPFFQNPAPGAVTSLEGALKKLEEDKNYEHYNALFQHLKAFWLVEKTVSKSKSISLCWTLTHTFATLRNTDSELYNTDVRPSSAIKFQKPNHILWKGY